MKSFNYHSVKSVKEAIRLSSGKSAYLAGGMTTIPSMKLRLASYSDIIDIKNIKDLSGIKVSGKSVKIGAITKHADVASSKEIKKTINSLTQLAEGIGDPQVRNRGTIGGSIANNDPAADYPSACLALNATIHTSKRKVQADKFFKGMFETDLKKGELIEAVEFEVPEKSNYSKFSNPASRYAIVGVYVAKFKKEIRVAVTGVESCVFRCKKIENALSGNFSPSAIDTVNISSKGFNADIHASAEYRAHLISILAKKAVAGCK
jgi:carbon-monoxide dehydrogenase medium subunit|tara:strand:+ start:146 stop:934 length:789 start_codon:yes stop_codon:yes gene_type:complete